MASLAEQYRPTVWEDVAGQDDAVRAIRKTLARGWGGRAWWITGASGTGKTTLAKLIAAEGASEFMTDELDAGSITPAKLRELERDYRLKPLPMDGKSGAALVVNECHKLRKDGVTAFLDVLERLPAHVCWIFTTTRQGQESLFDDDVSGDCLPLVSRCVEVSLADGAKTRQALARRAKWVAQAAGIDGLPDDVYMQALDAVKGNLRALLARVESGQLASAAAEQANAYLQQPFSRQDAATRARMQELVAQLGK